MKRYTIRSWNNAEPEHFDDEWTAYKRATERARLEKAIIKVRDNLTTEIWDQHADGTHGTITFDDNDPKLHDED